MVNELDRVDLKIISELQKDGRISVTELAERVKSSRATITSRLNRLIDEELVMVGGGLNLRKLGLKVTIVGLEARKPHARKELELHLFRTPEKANIHAIVWGEDERTIHSTIESFRELQDVDIIHSHYLGTPFHGNMLINVESEPKAETPCGKICGDCYRYDIEWCVGCPASKDYKNPFLK